LVQVAAVAVQAGGNRERLGTRIEGIQLIIHDGLRSRHSPLISLA